MGKNRAKKGCALEDIYKEKQPLRLNVAKGASNMKEAAFPALKQGPTPVDGPRTLPMGKRAPLFAAVAKGPAAAPAPQAAATCARKPAKIRGFAAVVARGWPSVMKPEGHLAANLAPRPDSEDEQDEHASVASSDSEAAREQRMWLEGNGCPVVLGGYDSGDPDDDVDEEDGGWVDQKRRGGGRRHRCAVAAAPPPAPKPAPSPPPAAPFTIKVHRRQMHGEEADLLAPMVVPNCKDGVSADEIAALVHMREEEAEAAEAVRQVQQREAERMAADQAAQEARWMRQQEERAEAELAAGQARREAGAAAQRQRAAARAAFTAARKCAWTAQEQQLRAAAAAATAAAVAAGREQAALQELKRDAADWLAHLKQQHISWYRLYAPILDQPSASGGDFKRCVEELAAEPEFQRLRAAIAYLKLRRATPSADLPPTHFRSTLALPHPYLMEALSGASWAKDVPDTEYGFVKALLWATAHTQHLGPLARLVAYIKEHGMLLSDAGNFRLLVAGWHQVAAAPLGSTYGGCGLDDCVTLAVSLVRANKHKALEWLLSTEKMAALYRYEEWQGQLIMDSRHVTSRLLPWARELGADGVTQRLLLHAAVQQGLVPSGASHPVTDGAERL